MSKRTELRAELLGQWNATMGEGEWNLNDLMASVHLLVRITDEMVNEIRSLQRQVETLQIKVENIDKAPKLSQSEWIAET